MQAGKTPDNGGVCFLISYLITEYKETAVQAQVETDYFASLGNTR